jgi:hypothetical protein
MCNAAVEKSNGMYTVEALSICSQYGYVYYHLCLHTNEFHTWEYLMLEFIY